MWPHKQSSLWRQCSSLRSHPYGVSVSGDLRLAAISEAHALPTKLHPGNPQLRLPSDAYISPKTSLFCNSKFTDHNPLQQPLSVVGHADDRPQPPPSLDPGGQHKSLYLKQLYERRSIAGQWWQWCHGIGRSGLLDLPCLREQRKQRGHERLSHFPEDKPLLPQ